MGVKLLLCCAIFALVHYFRPRAQSAQRVQYQLGLVLAIGLGLSTLWTYTWYTSLSFFESDFAEYCVAVIEMNEDLTQADIPPKRSRLAALLPAMLSKVTGIMNGFALSSILSTVLTFLFVFVWATALGGVGAGIYSVGILSVMTPMVLMPHFLTFYPPIVCATVFAAAGLALWGRFRTPVTACMCGLGIATCLLIDVRGVVWAVPFWIGGVCLLSFNVKAQNVLSALLLHIPIWCSWFGGWWSYSSNASSLEKQLDVRPLYVGFDESNPLFQPPWTVDSGFVWGWFEPVQILDTVAFIWTQRSYPVPEAFLDWQLAADGPRDEIAYWTLAMGIGLIGSLVTMLFRTFGKGKVERVLLLLCTLSPFLLLFHSLQSMVEQHIRFYMHTMPGIAVVVGVGMAIRPPSKFALKWWYRVPLRLRIGTWLLAVSGLIYGLHFSQMSPFYAHAEWRHAWRLNATDWSRMVNMQQSIETLKPYEQVCASELRTEVQVVKPTVYP